MSTKIQVRRGTAADWSSNNPVLDLGELGFDTTNKILKIGNNINTWSTLPTYIALSNNANSFTGTQAIATGSDTNKGLIVKRNSAAQSANLLEFQSSTGSNLANFNYYGGLATPSIQNTAFTAAGVVTNNVNGFLATSPTLSATYGGTGNAYLDRTVVAQASMTTTVNGSATAGVMTSAFQSSGVDKYISLDASTSYYFEAFIPLSKAASATASTLQFSLIYLNASTGATTTPAGCYIPYVLVSTSASESSGTFYQNGLNVVTAIGNSSASAITRYLRIVGYILTSSTAAKMTIGFGQSLNATSGTPSTVNNYISVYKLTTSSTTLNGAWQS